MTEKRFSHKDKSLYIDNDYFCELEDGDEITELLNRQQYTVETLWKENEQLKKENKELKELVCEVDNELEIRDIVCGAGKFRLEEWGKHRYHQFYKGDEELEDETVVIMLMELEKENITIKNTIKEAYETERTALGKSVLKQLWDAIQ